MFYASVMGVDMGMFYKRRDYSVIVDGRNPIVAHEYLGTSVEGKDVFVADDIISSGESMLDIAKELKARKAKRMFAYATYPIFTKGLAKFDEAYEKGLIHGVFGTNLTYRTPELLKRRGSRKLTFPSTSRTSSLPSTTIPPSAMLSTRTKRSRHS